MITIVISLSLISAILAFAVFRLARSIFAIEDKVEIALDQIDDSYQAIEEILSRPLFFDSAEIREVHRQISLVNLSLINVAGTISEPEEGADPDAEDKNEE
jgi:uncharacterized membrane protein|tara:strand:+ start:877 stop:1179 length:303 start_codon:yes stop_codon:yes gene_type:complete